MEKSIRITVENPIRAIEAREIEKTETQIISEQIEELKKIQEKASQGDVEDDIDDFLNYTEVIAVPIILNRYGTSEEKLEELKKEGYKNEAIKLLESARKDAQRGSAFGDSNNENIKRFAKKAGVSLKDIGTSEEKLEELEKEGYKNGLKYYLDLIREKNPQKQTPLLHAIDNLRKCIEKVGVSLEYIGTSEKEIDNRMLDRFNQIRKEYPGLTE